MKTILFDLDGTLLAMDHDAYAPLYVRMLCRALIKNGCPAEGVADAIVAGYDAMKGNTGKLTNAALFANVLYERTGYDLTCRPLDEEALYAAPYDEVLAATTSPIPAVRGIIDELKATGVRLVLATTPIFPRLATLRRMERAGLTPDDFALVTTYEEFGSAKPSRAYYEDILARIGARAEECLMIGNDTHDDMAAAALGMQVFLVTDGLLNTHGHDIGAYPHGDLAAMREAALAFAEKKDI